MQEQEPTSFDVGALPHQEPLGIPIVVDGLEPTPIPSIEPTFRQRLTELGVEIISLPFMAFSRDTAKKIGARDHWVCQESPCFWEDVIGHPASYAEGFMVHASHKNHKRGKGYDDPSNGIIRCVACHASHDLVAVGAGAASLILNFGIYTERKARHMGYQIHLTLDSLERKNHRRR